MKPLLICQSRIWLQLLTIGRPSVSSLASCGNRIATLRLRQVLVSRLPATGNQKRSASTSPSCLGLTGDKGTFPRQQFPKCGATQSRRRLRFSFLSALVCVTRMKLAVLSVASFNANSRFASQVLHFFHSSIGASQPFFANCLILSVTA